jgi:hypothetical protein
MITIVVTFLIYNIHKQEMDSYYRTYDNKSI